MINLSHGTNQPFFIIIPDGYFMGNSNDTKKCATCDAEIEPSKGMVIESSGMATLIFFCNVECYDKYES